MSLSEEFHDRKAEAAFHITHQKSRHDSGELAQFQSLFEAEDAFYKKYSAEEILQQLEVVFDDPLLEVYMLAIHYPDDLGEEGTSKSIKYFEKLYGEGRMQVVFALFTLLSLLVIGEPPAPNDRPSDDIILQHETNH